MLEGGEERNTYVVSALGGVGTGKSSLLNAITGEYTFETGDGTDVSNRIKRVIYIFIYSTILCRLKQRSLKE